MLSDHWVKVIETRADKGHETAPEGLFTDFFQSFPVLDKGEKEKGVLELRCLVNAPAPFWEVCLAFYFLFFPEIWPWPQFVARDLMAPFNHPHGPNPAAVANFEPYHAKFLSEFRDGQKSNRFLSHPIECAIAIFVLLFSEGVEGEEKRLAEMERLEELKTLELAPWEEEWKSLE